MDTLSIHDLAVSTKIGVTDAEKETPQTVKISVEIQTDLSKAGSSDAMRDTIDYAAVATAISGLSETPRNTIERLAEDVATLVLKQFGGTSVTVTVKKFILPDTDHVAVSITRSA